MTDEIDADVLAELRQRKELADRMEAVRNARRAARLVERHRVADFLEQYGSNLPEPRKSTVLVCADLVRQLPEMEGL